MKPRLILFPLLCGILLAAGWGLLAPKSSLRITDAVAVPIAEMPHAVRVWFRLANDGPPAQITGVAAGRYQASLYAPDATRSLPLPAGAEAIFAEDGAHVVVTLDEPARDGLILPVDLTLATGKTHSFRARVVAISPDGQAGEVGLFGFGEICRAGPGEPAPGLSISARADGDGWIVDVLTRDFQFTRDFLNGPHIAGTGHGHLYVGGVKLARLFAPSYRIPALPKGDHIIRVTLNTNDHRAYVVDDIPVTAIAKISVR